MFDEELSTSHRCNLVAFNASYEPHIDCSLLLHKLHCQLPVTAVIGGLLIDN